MSAGKIVLTATALFTAISPFVADWNETHIHNPNWPPHAKFHNGQTMSMGAALGLSTLAALWWRRRELSHDRLLAATTAASLYWITQASAALYPDADFYDPETPRLPANQIVLFVLPILGLNAAGYALERRRLR
ncbi:DUF6640 family protein [Nonomuraea africana]|uniref:Acetyltransferase n=1 Tax=Nonomuraea africana TaxID=46171 RepID=A0ABR9KDX3_9ACTN|nr:DUF6640 family protein [Nonomuraea africana]MBE1560221.1 hypothetical protein [Nonomuraea africana]